MKHLPRLLIAALSLLITAPALAAEENAADLYREAFEQMKLTDAEQDRLREAIASDEGLPADVKLVLNANADAIFMGVKAAQAPEIDWGLDESQGLMAEMPWLADARKLAYLLAAGSRMAAEADRGSIAAQLIAANLELARDVGSDPLIVSRLVQIGIELLAINAAEQGFDRLSDDDLKRLREQLKRGTDDSYIAPALTYEGELVGKWLESQAQFPTDAVETLIGEDVPTQGFEQAWQDETRRDQLIAGVRQAYRDAATAANLPRQQRDRALAEIEEKLDARAYGDLAGLFVPSAARALEAADRADVNLALLRAAIAYRLDGEAGLKAVPDPAGEGPFELTETAKGFTLTSTMKVRGEPVSLTVRMPK